MWRYTAASTTGTSHIRTGLPCQDRFVCKIPSAGYLLIAVADGAGSASQSEIGAELATTVALESLAADISLGTPDLVDAVRRAMHAARERVLREAADLQVESRELSSTLLITVLGPDGGAAAQIGDGVITAKEDSASEWFWVFWPQKGEFANVTRFLVDDDAPDAMEITRLSGDICDIAVMTDGLESLALEYASRSAYANFLEGMLQPLRAVEQAGEVAELLGPLQAFLESSRVRERTDDDLTLVLASRLD